MKESVALFVVTDKSKVLLVHPSGNYNKKAPWMPPKEELEADESHEDAIWRVMSEELQLDVTRVHDIKPLGTIKYASGSKKVHCFIGHLAGEKARIVLDWENDAFKWCTREEAFKLIKKDFYRVLATVLPAIVVEEERNV